MDTTFLKILIMIKTVNKAIVYSNEDRKVEFTINPYDLYALKEIIKLKKKIVCKIICISMGREESKDVLKRCLAMGADEVYLLSDRKAFAESDTVATAKILARAIEKIGCADLIVCGNKTVDGETGQVKYGITENMGIPSISDVEEIYKIDSKEVYVRIKNDSEVMEISATYPVLISFRQFTMVNDMISLIELKKAYRKPVYIWGRQELEIDEDLCGRKGSFTQVVATTPIKKEINKIQCIEGDIEEQARFLMELINHNS